MLILGAVIIVDRYLGQALKIIIIVFDFCLSVSKKLFYRVKKSLLNNDKQPH